MPLTTGNRLGSYEILSLLGVGGMGEVYRARDTKLNRDVAIKILPELFARDPDRVARFQREAQLLAALSHPNIAAIYGLEEANGSSFLVLELVSPEQAKARKADKRGDVWAFGCVLYEMLTGKRAFGGEDVSETLVAILRDAPDWDAIPADAPEPIRALTKRCLEKDRHARISDIAVAKNVLADGVLSDPPRGDRSPGPNGPGQHRRRSQLARGAGGESGEVGNWIIG